MGVHVSKQTFDPAVPPSTPVEWLAMYMDRIGVYVSALTWFEAREKAAVHFGTTSLAVTVVRAGTEKEKP